MDRNLMYRKMHAILRELGIQSAKPHILAGYGVDHTSELSDQDLQHLVDRLEEMKTNRMNYQDTELKHWRSVLMNLLNRYGVYATADDWNHVNRFLLDKRVSGKLLYEMNLQELKQCCVRVRAILKVKSEQKEKYERLTILN